MRVRPSPWLPDIRLVSTTVPANPQQQGATPVHDPGSNATAGVGTSRVIGRCSPARSTSVSAALMRPTWVNACGKFPDAAPVAGSISSAIQPDVVRVGEEPLEGGRGGRPGLRLAPGTRRPRSSRCRRRPRLAAGRRPSPGTGRSGRRGRGARASARTWTASVDGRHRHSRRAAGSAGWRRRPRRRRGSCSSPAARCTRAPRSRHGSHLARPGDRRRTTEMAPASCIWISRSSATQHSAFECV